MMEEVILIDEEDNQIGVAEKMETHLTGALHRAFSILVFNTKGELMLQQRAKTKYHSGGLWTNTCCSHPRPGEELASSVHRRLKEEMGFDCELKEVFTFIYKVHFENKLFEHELDHVFTGYYGGEPMINGEEADAWKWMRWEEVKTDVEANSGQYSYWFREVVRELVERQFQPEI